jgi:hypothetical protein
MNDFREQALPSGIVQIIQKIPRGVEVRAYVIDNAVRGTDVIKAIVAKEAAYNESISISGAVLADGKFIYGKVQKHDDLLEALRVKTPDETAFGIHFEIDAQKAHELPLKISLKSFSVHAGTVAELLKHKDNLSIQTIGKSITSEMLKTEIFVGSRVLPIYSGAYSDLRWDDLIDGVKRVDFTTLQSLINLYNPNISQRIVFDYKTGRLAGGSLHSVAAAKLGHADSTNLIEGLKIKDPEVSTIDLAWNRNYFMPKHRDEVLINLATELKKSGEDGNTLIRLSFLSTYIKLSISDILEGKLHSK